MSIKWQIITICIILVTIPVVTAGILSYTSSEKEVYLFVENKFKEQTAMILNHIETAMRLTQQQINSNLNVAHELFYSYGTPQLDPSSKLLINATNQLTGNTTAIEIPMMTINSEPVANNFEIVDKIQSLLGGTATIFQMIPEGALRISTNVLQQDETRAVGTYIPTTSPVYQTVMKGEVFYGRAYVVNAWYQTAYEAISDRQGTIIGMLYVGVKDASKSILDNLAEIVVGKTGYVWIINLNGEYILSYNRQRDGENIFDTRDSQGRAFIQEWIQKAPSLKQGETIIDYYPWTNSGKVSRMKITAYTYFPEWEWIIGASANIEDFQDSLKKIRMITIVVSCVAILLGSIVAYLFALFIIKPLFKSVVFAKSVAEGNLMAQIDIHRKDEIGILTNTLRTMQDKITHVLQEINRLIQEVQAGKLGNRGDIEPFDGAWRELITGVNHVMEEMEKTVAETKRQKQETERQKAEVEQQNWIKDGIAQLNSALAGDYSLVEICDKAISFVARYVGVGQGALYTYNAEQERLKLHGTYAFIERDHLSNEYKLGEGVIGQVAFERIPILLKHPTREDSLILTGTVSEIPLNTYTFPLLYNEELYGVLELASFEPFDARKQEFFTEANRVIATALFSAFQKEEVHILLQRSQQAAKDAGQAKEEAQQQTREAQLANGRL